MPMFLGRIERLLERAFEVPTQRFFRTRLQPVELARALGRAMVAEGQIGPEGLSVPNHYVVELHPDDYAHFAGNRESLERDLAAYVMQQTQRRGWVCPGWPAVELRPAEDVPRGQVRMGTSRVDGKRMAPPSPLPGESLESTSVLPPRPRPRGAAVSAERRAWLELRGGRRVDLGVGRVKLGRADDNDVVLDHESVSRHHAEIRRDGDRITIRDLGSTNGTRVDGQPVRELRLGHDATIHIGAVPMRLRVGD
jgi:hypothetical protein